MSKTLREDSGQTFPKGLYRFLTLDEKLRPDDLVRVRVSSQVEMLKNWRRVGDVNSVHPRRVGQTIRQIMEEYATGRKWRREDVIIECIRPYDPKPKIL